MINIFNFLQDILYKKKGDLLDDPDNEQVFIPYLMSRWLSMYSPNMAKFVNLTINRLYPVYENKQDWYQAYLGIVPKSHFKRIKYIKKIKKEDQEEDEDRKQKVKLIADSYQMSQREVELYLKEYNIDLKKVRIG